MEGWRRGTWGRSSNKGSGTLYECSNQGVCNHDTGVCECFLSVAYGEVQFRALSSNGQFELGNRGDCGFIEKAVPSCFVAGKDVCNGHGFCSNVTHTCQCTSGWHGITCGLRSCPLVSLAGRSSVWFCTLQLCDFPRREPLFTTSR